MKKINRIILTILLHLVPASVLAIDYTNKTFMALPSPHFYLPMKYTSWHRIIKQGTNKKDPWGATMQVVPFYRMSNNDVGLGIYFGTNYKQTIHVNRISPEADVKSDLIFHRAEPPDPVLKGTIKLAPKHTSFGIYFSYQQELNHINKGLFCEVNIPIQDVENDLRFGVLDEVKEPEGGLCDYFTGRLIQTADPNQQEPLRYLKMCGPQSKSGIADIEFLIGYRFTEKTGCQLNGAVKAMIPTGNKPSPCYLFPPVVGNGKHWGLGLQTKGALNILKGDDYSFEWLFNIDYTYLFQADHQRTLGYRKGFDYLDTLRLDETSAVMAWNYYLLAGEQGNHGVFPFANVLTREVSVHPGGRLQVHSSFAYHRNNTTIDFGYSFYAQEGEDISLRCWENDKYAPAHPEYPTDQPFSVLDFATQEPIGWSIGGPIQSFMLDVNTPATPAVLKHAVHGAISYTVTDWDNPFMMGCGFSVDWTQDNATATGYTLWAKAAITF